MTEQRAAQCFFTEGGGGGGSFHSQCMDQGPEYWHTTAASVTQELHGTCACLQSVCDKLFVWRGCFRSRGLRGLIKAPRTRTRRALKERIRNDRNHGTKVHLALWTGLPSTTQPALSAVSAAHTVHPQVLEAPLQFPQL